jgi:ribonuclease Y
MLDPVGLIVGAIAGAVVGGIGAYWMRGVKSRQMTDDLAAERQKIDDMRAKAEEEVREIHRLGELKAKERAEEERTKLDRELGKRRAEVERKEQHLKKREEKLDRRDETILKREESLEAKERRLEELLKQRETELEAIEDRRRQLVQQCEQVAGLSVEEAKALLLKQLEKEVRADAAQLVRRVEKETEEICDRRARELVLQAIQRVATETVSESTVSVVNLPSEEMKGRIIGREGRNIRALEQATGVNIIVDDTPEAVVLSSFDPMRREIARRVLDKLISDGRIHPSRIEEIVEKTERQVLDEAREAGEAACLDLHIYDIHPEIVKMMGRLKFRTSYGQNILAHSIEVARLAEVLANELGLDAKLAKRAAFLHDIGKAMTYEQEGTHAALGAEFIRKNREKKEVVHAVAAHHYEVQPETVTALLVIIADSISASRPGARRESLESYIKRLEQLEKICKDFHGVEKAFAVQAGREVRIIVQPDKLDDAMCALLARDVTKRIEGEMQYPGQIKVTVLRETRSTEFAK